VKREVDPSSRWVWKVPFSTMAELLLPGLLHLRRYQYWASGSKPVRSTSLHLAESSRKVGVEWSKQVSHVPYSMEASRSIVGKMLKVIDVSVGRPRTITACRAALIDSRQVGSQLNTVTMCRHPQGMPEIARLNLSPELKQAGEQNHQHHIRSHGQTSLPRVYANGRLVASSTWDLRSPVGSCPHRI